MGPPFGGDGENVAAASRRTSEEPLHKPLQRAISTSRSRFEKPKGSRARRGAQGPEPVEGVPSLSRAKNSKEPNIQT